MTQPTPITQDAAAQDVATSEGSKPSRRTQARQDALDAELSMALHHIASNHLFATGGPELQLILAMLAIYPEEIKAALEQARAAYGEMVSNPVV